MEQKRLHELWGDTLKNNLKNFHEPGIILDNLPISLNSPDNHCELEFFLPVILQMKKVKLREVKYLFAEGLRKVK